MGVNLPMLLRVICYAALPLHELEQYALTGGTQGMFAVDISTGAPVCTLSPAAVAPPNAPAPNATTHAAQDAS